MKKSRSSDRKTLPTSKLMDMNHFLMNCHLYIFQLTDAEHRCVYWNRNLNSSERWLSDGCSVLSNNATHTICSCNHLTSFAILVNHRGFKSVDHDKILTYLTWTGLSLSLFCLALCIFTFIYFRSVFLSLFICVVFS